MNTVGALLGAVIALTIHAIDRRPGAPLSSWTEPLPDHDRR